jgi:hypothetical protein
MTFGFISGAKFLLSRNPKNSIFFENLSSQKDGYGAQIQRILSVKSLANLVHQPFIFNPLSEVEDQITQETLSGEAKNEEISQFNSWLRPLLDSQEQDSSSFYRVVQIDSPFEFFYQSLRFYLLSRIDSSRIKFRLENAYFLTQINPDSYLTHTTPRKHVEDNLGRPKEIHVHLRFANFSTGTFRSLNSNFYFETLDRVIFKLDKAKIEYKIFLHSDFNVPFDETKTKQITQMTKDHLFQMKLIDYANMPDKKALDAAHDLLRAIHDRYRNVEISGIETALGSLQSMISADFLILSKSSFAFVAGILNQKGEIFSPEYWIKLPTTWHVESGF